MSLGLLFSYNSGTLTKWKDTQISVLVYLSICRRKKKNNVNTSVVITTFFVRWFVCQTASQVERNQTNQ